MWLDAGELAEGRRGEAKMGHLIREAYRRHGRDGRGNPGGKLDGRGATGQRLYPNEGPHEGGPNEQST